MIVVLVANVLIPIFGWSRLFEALGVLSIFSLIKAGFFDKDFKFKNSNEENYIKIYNFE